MSTSPPYFACVIPTHNRPHLLREALASVRSQIDGPRIISEVVVVIDDANEESAEVVRGLAAGSPFPVRAVLSDRTPKSAAQSRNVGVESTSAPYLAFLDDDDLWHPHHLLRAAEIIQEIPSTQMVVSSRMTENSNGDVTQQESLHSKLVSIDHTYMSGCVATGSNLIISRDAYQSVGGYDSSLVVLNDTDFFVRLLQHGVQPSIDSEVSVTLRIHEGDQLSRANSRRASGMRDFYAKHRSRMSRRQRRGFRFRMYGMHRIASTNAAARSYYVLLQVGNLGFAELPVRLRGGR